MPTRRWRGDEGRAVTDGPYDLGTSWRGTRRMVGSEDTTHQVEVTLAEAPTRTVVEADSPGVSYITEFTRTPTAHGTLLRVRFTAVPGRSNPVQNALCSLFGTLGANATGKMMAKDLDDIAARAESA